MAKKIWGVELWRFQKACDNRMAHYSISDFVFHPYWFENQPDAFRLVAMVAQTMFMQGYTKKQFTDELVNHPDGKYDDFLRWWMRDADQVKEYLEG